MIVEIPFLQPATFHQPARCYLDRFAMQNIGKLQKPRYFGLAQFRYDFASPVFCASADMLDDRTSEKQIVFQSIIYSTS